ncbi:hypothetical protein OAP56_02650 [Rickettsiaceae bacterium]|nr:hypothetical protein [Rickettsiaceae bacterium]
MTNRKGMKLTQGQLEELRVLAQTKNLNEIADHFQMSKFVFKRMRKEQSEINQIYNSVAKVYRVFSPEEIQESHQLVRTLAVRDVAKHFNVSYPFFEKARKLQPELGKAILDGISERRSDFDVSKKQKKRFEDKKKREQEILESDCLSKRAPIDISPEDALKRFNRLWQIEKAKRLVSDF